MGGSELPDWKQNLEEHRQNRKTREEAVTLLGQKMAGNDLDLVAVKVGRGREDEECVSKAEQKWGIRRGSEERSQALQGPFCEQLGGWSGP